MKDQCPGSGAPPRKLLARNRGECPRCHTSVSITPKGVIHVHKVPLERNTSRW